MWDVMVGGVQIKEGDWVVLFYVFVNCDFLMFEEFDCFIFNWFNINKYFMFGYGIYFCMGVGIVCFEVIIMINGILDKFVVVEFGSMLMVWQIGGFFNYGFECCFVRFVLQKGGFMFCLLIEII